MELYNITDLKNSQTSINEYSIVTMIHIVSQVILFFIGTFIQTKIVSICKKEKGATLEIHASHSIVLIINFAFHISFDVGIYFLPSLSYYTGPWICYLASFVTYYCFYSIVANSLIVSIMKYLFIVHEIKPSSDQGSKIKSVFFFINLLHPLFLTLSNILMSDWGTNSSVKKCFGATLTNSMHFSSVSNIVEDKEKPFLCIFDLPNTNMSDVDIYFIAKQTLCIIRTIVNLAVNTNLLEIFFYYNIFRKMRW